MKITWLGHACFKVENKDYTIVFDPTEDNYVPGIGPIRDEADYVFCSHEHADHNAKHLIKLRNADSVMPFITTRIETYHDDQMGALRGDNLITVIDDGEFRYAHLGDLGCIPEDEAIKELLDLDLVFIPVGGHYTIDGKEAAKLVKMISPKVIVPMHYKDEKEGFGFDVISTVDDFINEMDCVQRIEGSMVELKKSEMEENRVIVLKPKMLSN